MTNIIDPSIVIKEEKFLTTLVYYRPFPILGI